MGSRKRFQQCGKCCNKKRQQIMLSQPAQYSVKDFVNLVLKELEIKFNWKGNGINSNASLIKINV